MVGVVARRNVEPVAALAGTRGAFWRHGNVQLYRAAGWPAVAIAAAARRDRLVNEVIGSSSE